MQLDKLQKEITSNGRSKVDTLEINVTLDDSSYARISAHYRSFVRTWGNENLSATFTEDEFKKYINTIFYIRVLGQSKSLREYTKFAKRAKIPALIYLVLEQLGYVQAKEIGLIVNPVMEIEKENKLTPSELEEISIHLQELENLGHEMGRGIPYDEGNCDFMLMQALDNVMATHDPKTHPVYAFLRSFVSMSSIEEFLKARIYFPDRDEYYYAYESLIRGRNV